MTTGSLAKSARDDQPKRKLFYGLFVFPLLIAVGMAVLLCTVVLLTREAETPESLITAIKTGSPSKRWQKAFELSNELNRASDGTRDSAVLDGISQILLDNAHYDTKTRAYMALALSHFHEPAAVESLRGALKDPDEDVRLYALWSLGALHAREAVADILPYVENHSPELRKTAAYVLGTIQEASSREALKTLLSDPVPDVRWNAALALARLKDASGLEILTKMLQRDELSAEYKMNEAQIEAVMTNAVKGLALIHRPEAFRILESVSKDDKNMRVRQAALNALRFQTGNTNS